MKKSFILFLVCPLFLHAQDSLKIYNNYDFVPGDTIVFEDHFTNDQTGEFPSHWELVNGQAVMNKVNDVPCFLLTVGNYVAVKPKIKAKNYLGDRCSVEFDTRPAKGGYGIIIFMRDLKGNKMSVSFLPDKTIWSYSNTRILSGDYPATLKTDYLDKWHHIALAYKDDHLKIYIDQYRILSVPDCGMSPAYLDCDGIASEKFPIVFTNMRVTKGAGMYIPGQKFTDAKIVTHGINFDVNKSTIRPESMGTLNMITQLMKENPELKFEVGGHTDSDGDDAYNLTLSQQRADAIKNQLINLGVDGSRLTTKGYGETKPISDNNTLEGKANNRRVEFVKL